MFVPPVAAGPDFDATGTVPFREMLRAFGRISALSFGGPAGQIAVMHRILVDEKRWIGEARFLHALNFCMILPGPEAQQLATYTGWLLHGVKGGLAAGCLFILPGFLSIMALSWVYVAFGDVPLMTGVFFGLKAAVLAIVLQAVGRIGRRALRERSRILIAAAAFLALFLFSVPFPLVILAAGATGWALARWRGETDPAAGSPVPPDPTPAPAPTTPSKGAGLPAVCVVLCLLWILPVAALALMRGSDNVFAQIALFFSQMAVVTFGGAYAVLAYVAQQAVETYGWLRPGEMLDGLGLAETTPGPLIMVTQFVGFLGAFRAPGALNPYLAGTLGGTLTTYVTFVPCFLWIFAGAPFVERLRENRAVAAALSAVAAAVVGVILNLAVWFAIHTLFARTAERSFGWARLAVPVPESLDPVALALTGAAIVAVFALDWGIARVLAACALAGAVLTLV